MLGSGDSTQRGSEWSIWDLHVHTPSSLVQQYGRDDDETWARFFLEIESLPRAISVIGINDYWFLDGYRRVAEAHRQGRMKNIKTFFPIVEMRLNQFGGSPSSLSRVNVHVLFDPNLGIDVIEQQFVNRLNPAFTLDPEAASPNWNGAVSRDSLADLGRQIKASVPDGERHRYGSDLTEGFNNLVVPLEEIQRLRESSFLTGRTLLGIGKTEWADIKWNDQSIASKKSIAAQAAFLFTAYEDVTRWAADVDTMKNGRVNSKILDCSDAHRWANSTEKDRLGNCYTWLNTTPTFTGLVHALAEFEHRVYVGLEPIMLGRVRSSPEQFLESVSFSYVGGQDNPLFSYDLPLNSGFVAVVGNKGQGKSALLDCIALGGNSARKADFAFLNSQRFLTPSNREASAYQVELRWQNGVSRAIQLDGEYSQAHQVSVEYLPQRYVERVCSSDPTGRESAAFEQELREVLFTHIPDSRRAGESTFDGLLGRVTRATQDVVDRLRSELQPLINRYATAVEFAEQHALPDIEARINEREVQIRAAENDLGEAREEFGRFDVLKEESSELAGLRRQSQELASFVEQSRAERLTEQKAAGLAQQSLLDLDSIKQRLNDLRTTARQLDDDLQHLLGRFDLETTGPLVDVMASDDLIAEIGSRAAIAEREAGRRAAALAATIENLDRQREHAVSRLAAEDSARELAHRKVQQGESRLRDLRGSVEFPESYLWLLDLRAKVQGSPAELEIVEDALLAHARAIHEALTDQLTEVETLHKPAAEFIANSTALHNAGLSFVAMLQFGHSWEKLSEYLDGRRTAELQARITAAVDDVDPTDWESLGELLRECLKRLRHERGGDSGQSRSPSLAVRSSTTLSMFVAALFDLRWLNLRIGLIGDGLPLAQLSPGQRGLVLALFYLVVDRRTSPLLLDQPEENLDNETIHARLVPAMKEAAMRRQTIIVTHNANLAVVGDADQVVHCRLQDGRFQVTSGSLAEMDMARHVVDVLEGTKAAFENRRTKYEVMNAR